MKIPNGTSGKWRVEEFEVNEEGAQRFNLRMMFQPGCSYRVVKPGKYKRLMHNNNLIMSNTPAELGDHWEPIYLAKGEVLLNGLGLGVVLAEILKKSEVKNVTIVEISPDVIKLVAPYFTKDQRVEVIQADAYKWIPPKRVRYDVVWHDIWDNICEDNLSGMHRLHRKYGRRTEWQGSWCRHLCEIQRKRSSNWGW